jgi:hypothetical protein
VLKMTLGSALLLGVGFALCGCSVPMGRSAAAGASAPLATCSRAGAETPNGGMACVGGSQYRCANGAWQPTALRCEP